MLSRHSFPHLILRRYYFSAFNDKGTSNFYYSFWTKSRTMATLPTSAAAPVHRNPNTLSNYHLWKTNHTTANFKIDFGRKRLEGNVVLELESRSDASTEQIVLDTSYLDIKSIDVDGNSPECNILPRKEPFGSALEVALGHNVSAGTTVKLNVSNATSL